MNATHSMTGRTCIVTGPTSGIGKAAAIELARAGAHLILICRNPAKAEALLSELVGDRHRVVIADLEALDNVRRAAAEIIAMGEPVHVLLNNAGIVAMKKRATPDGLESTFAVNHLAPFLLTNLLLDLLSANAPARIVNVASDAHRFTRGRLNFDNLQSERKHTVLRHYGATKLCNMLFTHELARRLENSNITVNALHPGTVGTGLGTDNGRFAQIAMGIMRPFGRTAERGAESSIYLCSSPDVEGKSGGYYFNCKPHKKARYAANDDDAARLWKLSCELTGLTAA